MRKWCCLESGLLILQIEVPKNEGKAVREINFNKFSWYLSTNVTIKSCASITPNKQKIKYNINSDTISIYNKSTIDVFILLEIKDGGGFVFFSNLPRIPRKKEIDLLYMFSSLLLKEQRELALTVIQSSRDNTAIKKVEFCYTPKEVDDAIEWLDSAPYKQKKVSKKLYQPSPSNGACIFDIIQKLALDSNTFFYPFKLKRLSLGLFVPFKQTRVYFKDIIWSPDSLSCYFALKVPGIAKLKRAKEFNLSSKFRTHTNIKIWVIKDGKPVPFSYIANIPINKNQYAETRLDLTKLPLLNRFYMDQEIRLCGVQEQIDQLNEKRLVVDLLRYLTLFYEKDDYYDHFHTYSKKQQTFLRNNSVTEFGYQRPLVGDGSSSKPNYSISIYDPNFEQYLLDLQFIMNLKEDPEISGHDWCIPANQVTNKITTILFDHFKGHRNKVHEYIAHCQQEIIRLTFQIQLTLFSIAVAGRWFVDLPDKRSEYQIENGFFELKV